MGDVAELQTAALSVLGAAAVAGAGGAWRLAGRLARVEVMLHVVSQLRGDIAAQLAEVRSDLGAFADRLTSLEVTVGFRRTDPWVRRHNDPADAEHPPDLGRGDVR